jgi:excisionase family DNA binding protein
MRPGACNLDDPAHVAHMPAQAIRAVEVRGGATVNEMEHQWLTTADLARMFEMSEATIRRWARQHKLPHLLSPGGQYRFDADEIRYLIEQRRIRFSRRMTIWD